MDLVEMTALKEAENGEVAANGGLVRVAVVMTHVTPLLMNAMSEELLLNIRERRKLPKTAAKPSLREEAMSKLHVLPDGSPHLPVPALYATLVNAGQFIRLDGRRQISTAKSTVLPGMVTIEDPVIRLFKPGTDELAAWEVDIQQGRDPHGGEAVCIVRPRFDQWEIRYVVEIDQQQIAVEMVRELIAVAGRRIGFLDARPQRRGNFGRSAITYFGRL